jgi:hypothetical protein
MSKHTVRMFSPPRSKWAGWLTLVFILFLALYPSPVFPWSPVSRNDLYFSESDYREAGAFLQSNTKPDAIVVSDAYWLTSWYGDRASLWFPVDVKTLEEIEREFIAVDAVFLTPKYVSEASKTDAVWLSLYSSPKPFEEFQIVKEFVSAKGLRVVLFLKSGG